MTAVVPTGNEMNAASEGEYKKVMALLDEGHRLSQKEIQQIQAKVDFYENQSNEEYEAGFLHCTAVTRPFVFFFHVPPDTTQVT